jgi:DNA-binding beta-propeller fold protein YncE
MALSAPRVLPPSPSLNKRSQSEGNHGAASVLDVASGKVEHIIPVSREPEGVALSPNGKLVATMADAEARLTSRRLVMKMDICPPMDS